MRSPHAVCSMPSRIVTDSGVEHVRLAYHYLDTGDLDGFGSLLHEDTGGRSWPEHSAVDARHHIRRIVADGDCVVVMGLLWPQQHEFVDVFALSPEGMLSGFRRYYVGQDQRR